MPADSTSEIVKFTISIPRESCINAKAKYSSSVVPPDPSVHFYHWLSLIYQRQSACSVYRDNWLCAAISTNRRRCGLRCGLGAVTEDDRLTTTESSKSTLLIKRQACLRSEIGPNAERRRTDGHDTIRDALLTCNQKPP